MGLPKKLLLLFVVTNFFVASCALFNEQSVGDLTAFDDGAQPLVQEESDIALNELSGPGMASEVDVVTAREGEGGFDEFFPDLSLQEELKQSSSLGSEQKFSEQGGGQSYAELTKVTDVALLPDNSGMVSVSLSQESAFVLIRESSNEYSLQIPGAEIGAEFPIAQVLPFGDSRIRSARVVPSEHGVEVRMFVDETISLLAKPSGNTLYVRVVDDLQADDFAMAQLSEGEGSSSSSGESRIEGKRKRRAKKRRKRDPLASDKVYTGRLISLDLQDADIDNALRIIAEVSQLNIIASEDVQGQVTLRLIDVPWDQALDVILKTHGLDQVRENNVIRIAPIEALRAEREALLEAKRAAENLEDLQVRYIKVSYSRAEEVQPLVESLLTERGSVESDPRTNQLIIRDIEMGLSAATELVKKLDLRTPQILLETQIVEANRSFSRQLGFQWTYNFSRGPQFANATGKNFPYAYDVSSSSNFGASEVNDDLGGVISGVFTSANGAKSLVTRLSALEKEGLAEIISRPQVATVNNKEATIKSVETIRVPTTTNTTTVATGEGNTVGSQSNAFEEFDVGIELKVTPQASPDYYVLMDIFAKSSTLSGSTFGGIPSTFEREATSTVLVESGQTFALGGVYRVNDRDNISGLPWLKDIPFLGHLFRSTDTSKKNEELIFFITPHIVEGSFDSGLM